MRRKYGILIALCFSLVLGTLTHFALIHCFGYDHVRAFLTASTLENPNGFIAFHKPFQYVMTRIENVAEIALFLSIGVLALLFHKDHIKIRIGDLHDDITSIFLAGVCSLLLMFLTGAFRTGETARTCLFIYPYFMLVLRKLEEPVLRSAIIIAGLQSIIMQTFGEFFW